jgi:hypothetical protein
MQLMFVFVRVAWLSNQVIRLRALHYLITAMIIFGFFARKAYVILMLKMAFDDCLTLKFVDDY